MSMAGNSRYLFFAQHSAKRMIILSPEVSFGGQCVHVRLHALPVFV
jgi:hypothetical protein